MATQVVGITPLNTTCVAVVFACELPIGKSERAGPGRLCGISFDNCKPVGARVVLVVLVVFVVVLKLFVAVLLLDIRCINI